MILATSRSPSLASGPDGEPVYHTNVMMCIGTAFAVVGLEMIRNRAERQDVRSRLEKTGKEIVELSADQIANFAGNAIELHNQNGEKLLVLSTRAAGVLTEEQRKTLSQYTRLVRLELPTIELGGGSARCMIATIHLPPAAIVAALCEVGRETRPQQTSLKEFRVLAEREAPQALITERWCRVGAYLNLIFAGIETLQKNNVRKLGSR